MQPPLSTGVAARREGMVKSVITVACSILQRSVLLLVAVVLSVAVLAALLLGPNRHPKTMKVAEVVLYVTLLYVYVVISFRFVVRLDERQISRRSEEHTSE